MEVPTPTAGQPRSIKWTYPVAILAGGAALFAFARFNPWIQDRGTLILSGNIAITLTAGVLLVWVVRNAPVSRRSKGIILGGLTLLLVLFVATMRTKWTGDLWLTWRPRNWVVNILRYWKVDVGDVIHTARLADPPLVLTPGPGDSPRFLGPTGDGKVAFAGGRVGRDWSQKPPRELWRGWKVGLGWSSFAVVGRYGFTQEQTTDLRYEQVTCYDIDLGQVVWAHSDAGSYTASMGWDGPRATPTYFAGKLVTIGATGLMNCFDATTGRRLWTRNPLKDSDASPPEWGVASSPLVFHSEKHGDLVVQSAGGSKGKSLHAYRLDDGREVWSVGNDPPGYCTPALHTLGGVPQIVLVNFQTVTGHEPDTGAELWRYAASTWVGGQPKVPQPIVLDDRRVLISAGYGTGCVMLEVGKGADGKWTATPKWQSNKLKPKFTNLIVRDEHAYGLDDGAFLVCIDLKDGDLKWRSRRGSGYGHGQILLVDDVLLVQSDVGDVALVAADPKEFRELTRFTALPRGTSWNQPIVTGRKLLVRNEEEAACFELPTE